MTAAAASVQARGPQEAAEPIPRLTADFFASMGKLAATVCIVTSEVDGRPWGMTVTACCSVSASPPTLLVSLATVARSALAIAEHGEFGVCILGSVAIQSAERGASPGRPKFLDENPGHLIDGVSRMPCVAGTLAHLDCKVIQTVAAADHTIFVGAVQAVTFPTEGSPLIYHSRQYHRLLPMLGVVPNFEQDAQSLLYSAW